MKTAFKKPKRILVTGGAGFIGSHLLDYHLNLRDEVWAVDDCSTGSEDNLQLAFAYPQFQFFKENILTWTGLKDAVLWATHIYHMAAVVGQFHVLEDPLNVLETNVMGTERVLYFASLSQSRPKVLIASSSEVYGDSSKPNFSETDEARIDAVMLRRSCYAVSKLMDEALSLGYHQKKSLQVVVARLFNTVGLRQSAHYGMVLPRFVNQALRKETLTVYGNGEQQRSFCDVKDMVVMLHQLLDSSEAIGQIVNVGHDQPISINELACKIIQLTKSSSEIKKISYEEAYRGAFHDIKRRCPNLTLLRNFIPYRAQWNIDQTISELVRVYQEQLS